MNISWQGYWKKSDGRPATREHLLMALADVEYIMIRATYPTTTLRTSISDVSMETASESVLMSEPALEVEQCVCPDGYEGLSCEVCPLLTLTTYFKDRLAQLGCFTMFVHDFDRLVNKASSNGDHSSLLLECFFAFQDCAPGFTRSAGGIYLGLCHSCQCNGHADSCDSETGVCKVSLNGCELDMPGCCRVYAKDFLGDCFWVRVVSEFWCI